MEKRVIATNPIFKEIVEICWEDAGGTDEMDSLEIKRSCQEFIPAAIQKSPTVQERCPAGVIVSSNQMVGLWREMQGFGLALTEKGKKRRWRKALCNPKRFNWETSKKAGYLWLKRKPKRETAVARVTPEEELSPEAIMKDELTAAQAWILELKRKKSRFREEINRLEELISQFQKILEVYEGLIKLEQEKISLLQPEPKETEK